MELIIHVVCQGTDRPMIRTNYGFYSFYSFYSFHYSVTKVWEEVPSQTLTTRILEFQERIQHIAS